jgi:hypothetical protein
LRSAGGDTLAGLVSVCFWDQGGVSLAYEAQIDCLGNCPARSQNLQRTDGSLVQIPEQRKEKEYISAHVILE